MYWVIEIYIIVFYYFFSYLYIVFQFLSVVKNHGSINLAAYVIYSTIDFFPKKVFNLISDEYILFYVPLSR